MTELTPEEEKTVHELRRLMQPVIREFFLLNSEKLRAKAVEMMEKDAPDIAAKFRPYIKMGPPKSQFEVPIMDKYRWQELPDCVTEHPDGTVELNTPEDVWRRWITGKEPEQK